MDIIRALIRMEKIEEMAAELYKYYHLAFKVDKEASYVFYSMYIEEKGHMNLVHYVKRLVRQNPKNFENPALEPEDLDRILERLHSEIGKQGRFSLAEALHVTEELESGLCEGYLKYLLSANNDILSNLYGALGDKSHVTKVSGFIKRRKEGVA